MPSINIDFLHKLQNDYRNYPNFIETGTYGGETVFALEPYFNKLYTIEVNEKIWYETVVNAEKRGVKKIDFYWEDSSKFFPKLLPEVKEPAIFFLDGHWCGPNTGLDDNKVPLLEELISINRDFIESAIIIIDDFRLFGTEYWEKINKKDVLLCVIDRIESVYHLPSHLDNRDRLIIHINKKNA